ncbi:NAD(P)/FAD-dependent oxidoreductase [Saccharopolyspora phatthalungensis]|uniref:NADH dehydrogenase FAD-containing subunit n=1 Tax=Saccharopolyspora phatthalungensis TaxID=664693 RepID=A0A840QK94_9PSEU|nr:FAD-dependent oxidoreductase [Saccharopolyspora phatthalungensis]MBB5159839.1 NADH dehydrogenase FAD-containing subunit [Saccharopolyspora phatthalungensis]
MDPTVVVIGGGYAGIAAAKDLDDVAHVVLVEPRDAFVHNVAALRGLVDPAWAHRLFYPYDELLNRGRVVRDRARKVDPAGVTLDSGRRFDADYIVLATGSTYPFPAKFDVADSASAKARIRATYDELTRAEHVLLLGAGPVGLELAGELKAAWPDKAVTIVDPAHDILVGGLPAELRTELRRQLAELNVELVLGAPLHEDPPSEPGEVKGFTATTTRGREIAADIWFRCYGIRPNSDYLAGGLEAARTPTGAIEVTPELHLPDAPTVFAIGDVTAIPEAKMAKAAGEHARIAAANIRTLILGDQNLSAYTPAAPSIALPLGPTHGATYAPEAGLLTAETTAQIKGQTLRTEAYEALLGPALP